MDIKDELKKSKVISNCLLDEVDAHVQQIQD